MKARGIVQSGSKGLKDVCVCIHTYTHIHMYTHMHTHIYMYTHLYIHMHTHAYTHTHIFIINSESQDFGDGIPRSQW